MRLFAVTPQQFEADFAHFAPLLEHFARQTGEMRPEDVRELVAAQSMQVWGIQDTDGIRFLATTEIGDTALDRVCVIRIACGGARVSLQERLLDEIGKWARDAQGCSRVRIYGRPGWLRRFRRFRPTGVIAEWNLRVN